MLRRKSEKDAHCRKVEQHIQTLRNLLSGKRVVALDTCVLGELEWDVAPPWFNHFKAMKDDGVRFAIPDLCVGERLECFANADPACLTVMKENWKRMVSRLDSIIWQDLPCLPLRGDLFDIVGIGERGPRIRHERPFTMGTSQELFKCLHDYENSRFDAPEFRMPFEEEMEEVRSKWKDRVLAIRAAASGIPKERLLSNILVRQAREFFFPGGASDIVELPFRFLIDRAYDSSYCNPDLGKRTINDGLDHLILYLTMASVNVCSTDRFFAQARNLGLPQSFCCHTPNTLLEAWEKGALLRVKVQG